MFPVSPGDISEAGPESILIYGSGETSISMLAVGLAQRVHPQFAWASCAHPTPEVEAYVARLVVRHLYGGRADPVVPTDLERQAFRPEAFDALIAPTAYRDLLLELLRLPALLQGVVPSPLEDSERPTLVLARIDALPRRIVKETLEDPLLHEALHRSRVTLVATFHGSPDPALPMAFDRVFRVEKDGGSHWTDALVWKEHELAHPDPVQPRTLRDAWERLGLDLALLREETPADSP